VNTPAVEPVLKSRLLPRFSFRFLFGVTFGFALLGATVQAAFAGFAVALGVLVFLGSLASFFVVGFLFYLVLWGLAGLRPRDDSVGNSGSPFADGQLPPQIMPPTNPSN
jgi:hypothetical protein